MVSGKIFGRPNTDAFANRRSQDATPIMATTN